VNLAAGASYLLVDDLTYNPPSSPPASSFIIGANPSTVQTALGQQIQIKTPITWSNNPDPSQSPVPLELAPPAGITGSFSPQTTTTGTSTLTLNIDKSTDPVNTSIAITGYVDKGQPSEKHATKIVPEEVVPIRKVGRLVLDRTVDNFFAETEQVAFCTQNIVPGVDFSNDPLLQGRNFSYLDTQLKRLGSPNFTHLPINAPKCPFHHFQQDGHMAFHNPKGRANYEPNSWGVGPRESPERGYRSYPAHESGEKLRVRAELFADHYSQARQFYASQTPAEQAHIKDAFVFELSKVETPVIRARMVSHLRNVDDGLARMVAEGLGLSPMPEAAPPARPVVGNLPPSPALSIVRNGPKSFKGRKVGALVTDGVDAGLLAALEKAVAAEGARLIVANMLQLPPYPRQQVYYHRSPHL